MPLAGLYKFQVHRPYCGQILVDHSLDRPSPFLQISGQPPDKAQIRIGIHIYSDVHQSAEFWFSKDQYTLNQDDRRWLYMVRFASAGVGGKVVSRQLDRPPGQKLLYVMNQQLGFQRVWVIKVDPLAVLG